MTSVAPTTPAAPATVPAVEAAKPGALDFASRLQRPQDANYQAYKRAKVAELSRYPVAELQKMLRIQQQRQGPVDDTGGALTKELLSGLNRNDTGMLAAPVNEMLQKNLLGSAAGGGLTDGSSLIRQDLETIVEALYVKVFPLYEAIRKVPANGLSHNYDVMTTPDPNMSQTGNTVSTLISELSTVAFTASTYARKTTNISLFGVGRGVSFLELGAVKGGGMPFNPTAMELAGGVIKIAYDVQTLILSGNGSYASGLAANEGGVYLNNPTSFDGCRLVLGSVSGSSYSGNNAVQLEQGSLNLTQALRRGLTQSAQNGGLPDWIVGTIMAKNQLDEENEQNKRYNDTVEVIPGVVVNQIAWANGNANILAVPGYSFGAYTSPISAANVEDVYFLQSDEIELPWLYNEGISVIELPAALDYTLSQRYIIFAMYGLAIKAPVFMGKVRRIAN
jgi:hypothetical protein